MSRRIAIGEVDVDPALPVVVTEPDGSVKRHGCLRDIFKTTSDLKGAVASMKSQMEAGDKVLAQLRTERAETSSVLGSLRAERDQFKKTAEKLQDTITNAPAPSKELIESVARQRDEARAKVEALEKKFQELKKDAEEDAEFQRGIADKLDKERGDLYVENQKLKEEVAGTARDNSALYAEVRSLKAEIDRMKQELRFPVKLDTPPDTNLSHINSTLVRHGSQIARLLRVFDAFKEEPGDN